jgi:hypothetical protein
MKTDRGLHEPRTLICDEGGHLQSLTTPLVAGADSFTI